MMMLSQRDENILYSLDKLGYATTSQLQRLHELGSIRNAQRVLSRLSPYLHNRRLDEYVFYLSKKGRDLIGSDNRRTATAQLQHAAMRSEVYLLYSSPTFWNIEFPVMVDNKVFIVPDVTFAYQRDGERYLVEVDCSQHMRNNYKKLDKYAELKEMAGGRLPKLVWITKTAYRKEKLTKAMNHRRLSHDIYCMEDLK